MGIPAAERVIVATDLSEPARHALGITWQALAPGAHLHVVHVLPRIDPTFPGVVWSVDDDERRREHARRLLEAELPDAVLDRASLHVLVGDPGSRIADLAKELGADLVVTASHGRTGLARVTLGSVAERVVRLAPCSVLVVR